MSVCSGNICRSPAMEAVIRHHLPGPDHGSSGTGAWHVGEPADPRSQRVMQERGYFIDHRAQQFRSSFFQEFDLILVADRGHYQHVLAMAPDGYDKEKIRFLREWDPQVSGDLDIPDPYYGDIEDYELMMEIIERSVIAMSKQMKVN